MRAVELEVMIREAVNHILSRHVGSVASLSYRKVRRLLVLDDESPLPEGVVLHIVTYFLKSLSGRVIYDSAGRAWRLSRVYLASNGHYRYVFERVSV